VSNSKPITCQHKRDAIITGMIAHHGFEGEVHQYIADLAGCEGSTCHRWENDRTSDHKGQCADNMLESPRPDPAYKEG